MKSDKLEIKTLHDKIGAIVTGITPILNFINGNLLLSPTGNLDENSLPMDPFVKRCRVSWGWFKVYVRGTAAYAIGHALSVVRSWYPAMELGWIDEGFPKDMQDDMVDALQLEAEEYSVKLVDDLWLFGNE